MQGISDPDTFELSQVVEKNSKTGIFKNSRLLMIKDGFLYYFSKVPDNYKGHEPNLMGSLRQLPKSSIEIRSIHSISLQSAKSSTLIITFYGKDMIDREDIRKSLSSKNYIHPVKPNMDELEEWKFIFATVMKCRLWHGSLMKLKQHFSKTQDRFDKFAEYMANFDPEIRNSLPITSPKNPNNRSSVPLSTQPTSPTKNTNTMSPPPIVLEQRPEKIDKYKLDKQSGIFEIKQTQEEHDEDTLPKKEETSITPKNIPDLVSPKSIPDLISPKNNQIKSENTAAVKSPKKEEEIMRIQKIAVPQKIEQKESTLKIKPDNVEKSEKMEKNEKNDKSEKSDKNQKSETKIKPNIIEKSDMKVKPEVIQKGETKAKSAEIEEEIQKASKKKMEEMAEAIRQQERIKAEEQATKLVEQLKRKEEQLKKMSQVLENNRRQQELLEQKVKQEHEKRQEEQRLKLILLREKKQQEEYKRLRQSVEVETILPQPQSPPKRRQKIKEESIQTQYERQISEVMDGGGFKSVGSNGKNSRFSYKSETHNPMHTQRNTINLFRNTISYISEVKIQSTDDIENYDYYWEIGQIYKAPDLKQKIERQLAYTEFVRKASRKVTDIVVSYINENRPKQSIFIDRNIFEIEIVCEKGKIIRTEGSEQLIYSNQHHQRLKRTYKIYNQLNEMIVSTLKKKPNYPLRVPYCCLIEYKGYTALALLLPRLKENSMNMNYLRALGQTIPTYNLSLKDFQVKQNIYSLITANVVFKITKIDEPTLYRSQSKNFDFLNNNRKSNISIQSNKIFEQSKQIENNQKERVQIAQILTFCRQLKKVMKSSVPYYNQINQFAFFQEFMKCPQILLEQYFKEKKSQKLTGLIFYYFERLLGIKIKAKYPENSLSYSVSPVVRQFTLNNLDIALFANNFDKYCLQKKFDLAAKALNYRKYLEEQYSEILINEVYLHIHQQSYSEAEEKIGLALDLISIQDPRRIQLIELRAQCYEAAGRDSQALGSLKDLLQQTEYMYGSHSKLIDIYFLIAGLLSRQGLIPQLTQVYRKILHDSPQNRQKVLVDFSQNLLTQHDIDPHILLDFLHKELSQEIQQGQPLVQQFLGELYFRVKNKSKALGYFTSSFNNFLYEGKRYQNICETFWKIFQCCTSQQQRKSLHRQLQGKLAYSDFVTTPYCKRVNSLVARTICQTFNFNERDNLINFLEGNQHNQEMKLLDWNWLESTLKKVSRIQEITIQEKNALIANIDTAGVSEACILLNSPNFI